MNDDSSMMEITRHDQQTSTDNNDAYEFCVDYVAKRFTKTMIDDASSYCECLFCGDRFDSTMAAVTHLKDEHFNRQPTQHSIASTMTFDQNVEINNSDIFQSETNVLKSESIDEIEWPPFAAECSGNESIQTNETVYCRSLTTDRNTKGWHCGFS